jgi:hypothetical protein
MPAGDGTGPMGMGPGTGRGRGWCRTGAGFAAMGRTAFRGRNRWLFGLAAPVIIAAIRDLANPRGLLRQAASALLPHKSGNSGRHIRQNPEYTITDAASAGPVKKRTAHRKGTGA